VKKEAKKMETKNLIKALSIIAETQKNCAPVKLSIGFVDDDHLIQNSELVILSCPPAIIDALEKSGFRIEMSENVGMLVSDFMLR
jgi:hypothetical protein